MPVDVTRLHGLLRPDQVDTSPSSRALHARGESCDVTELPDVVLYPESTEDVRRVLAFAHETGTPVTPVAVNSSVEGQTVPLERGISLDLMRMNRILEVAGDDGLVVVQPAVTYPALNRALRHTGLFFPVDPGAEASLGGMISTNASGTMAVRYGVTSDLVLGLEVVTPVGRVIRTGGRSRKSSSSYQLTRLFCGAEGTLGVITEATVRVVPRPSEVVGARIAFPTVSACVAFVTELIQSGAPVARCELVDAPTIEAIRAHMGVDLEPAHTVFLEFHGDAHTSAAHAAAFARALAPEHGAVASELASDVAALDALWHARHQAFYALVARHPGMTNLLTDVGVPVSRMAEVIDGAVAAVASLGVPAYVLGHVGDGNFHMALFYEPDDEAARARVLQVHDALVQAALTAGGTCSGEHGIGLRKLGYVRAEHGDAVEVMWSLKDALDPRGIMNPGKKLPARR